MQWYYVKNGTQTGPVSEGEFLENYSTGTITDQTLVWNETMKDWQPYGLVVKRSSSNSISPNEETYCSMCGQVTAEREMIAFEGSLVCAACKPKFVQQIKESSEISGVAIRRYAGFWIRFGASFIDGLVTGVVTIPLNIAFQAILPQAMENKAKIPVAVGLYLLMLIIPALYFIWMNGKYGATLGKKAVGIKIIMSDGQSITYGRATGRYFAQMISGLILYIGYIMAGFDEEKRALHDRICNTRVVYK